MKKMTELHLFEVDRVSYVNLEKNIGLIKRVLKVSKQNHQSNCTSKSPVIHDTTMHRTGCFEQSQMTLLRLEE